MTQPIQSDYLSASCLRTIAIIFAVLVVLNTSVSYAQSRLTYGLEAGAGVSNITFDYRYATTSSTADDPVQVRYSSWEPYSQRRLATSLGGYVRYQFTPTWYLQSGVNYITEEDKISYREELLSPSGNTSVGRTLGYRLHQIEVPLLVGARFYERWRLYIGPALGVLVSTGNTSSQPSEATLATDPIFGNLRIGLGADLSRWSLDFAYHQTVQNNNRWRANSISYLIESEPFITQSKTGGEDMTAKRMILTVGYRLN